MSNRKKGLKIGHYRITPLGIGVLGALLLIVVALVALLIVNPFSTPDVQRIEPPKPTPTATPVATPVPTLQPVQTPAATPSSAPATLKPLATVQPPVSTLRSATIRSLGEIAIETDLLQSAFDAETSSFDFAPMFSEISAIIGDADYTVADVEGVLGNASVSGVGSKMITPASILEDLKEAGVDMLTLANDHALDGGYKELLASIENITGTGLSYIGASATEEERKTPVIKDINGIKVGFVAYTDNARVSKDEDKRALEYGLHHISNSNAASDIQMARAAGADVVVAYISWGKMLERTPSEDQFKLAKALTAAGADVIIGYNPHVVQSAGWLEVKNSEGTTNRALCLCATGNLLSNQRAKYSDSGVIFEFTIQEQEDGTFAIESPTYIPTYVWRYKDAESELYQYRVLPVGQWMETTADQLPEGMTEADVQRMGAIWTEVQEVISAEVATASRE